MLNTVQKTSNVSVIRKAARLLFKQAFLHYNSVDGSQVFYSSTLFNEQSQVQVKMLQ